MKNKNYFSLAALVGVSWLSLQLTPHEPWADKGAENQDAGEPSAQPSAGPIENLVEADSGITIPISWGPRLTDGEDSRSAVGLELGVIHSIPDQNSGAGSTWGGVLRLRGPSDGITGYVDRRSNERRTVAKEWGYGKSFFAGDGALRIGDGNVAGRLDVRGGNYGLAGVGIEADIPLLATRTSPNPPEVKGRDRVRIDL
ncbi:MAG: hypothetical protein AAB425_13945, partial [Bdellovibrionota bacterium]